MADDTSFEIVNKKPNDAGANGMSNVFYITFAYWKISLFHETD